ncbi:MAG: putative sulfate/molybdate transporter [Armatimonadota bacterium]
MSEQTRTRFRFTLPEFIGSLGDLGTLLPLLIGLIAFNGISAVRALVILGVTYILTGIYYRLPVPVQPLKATAMIAIATGASVGQIRSAALWMAGILFILSITKVADKLNNIFPKVLIQGLQFSLGIMMIRSGTKFVASYPDHLGAVVHGSLTAQHQVHAAGFLPSATDFWSALFLLVLPQLPLTLGNAIIATHDCSIKYFGSAGERVTASRLATTIGLGNLTAGLLGGMPMCHGAGGMTAHYHLGSRTGATGVMLGSIFLVGGLAGGHLAATGLSAVPAWALGLLLIYVGIRHGLLAKHAFLKPATAIAVLSMGTVGYFYNDMLTALGVGLAVKIVLQDVPAWVRRWKRPGVL